jgi:2-polyprenyl-3-methyl-5-hydroxy-6-metoxy-1,4-benzoquinol methylase
MTHVIERLCWCGESQFVDFSDDYLRCAHCGTLVSQSGLQPERLVVQNDSQDFYGKEYWLSHQREDLANPDIYQRARADLPERDLYWLRTLLAHKLPPGKILELGSAHGGFVALMRWAGFDAVGLEMSPWVVDFARQVFDVPMLLGQLEQQQLADGSFDAIVLYDVLEHLDNPLSTMRRCVELLNPDGVIIVQTPCYPESEAYAELVERHDPFLAHIDKKANQHLYLFSERAAQQLFEQLGMREVRFEPALFGYDMYFVASKTAIPATDPHQLNEALARSPSSRLIQALIDLDDRVSTLMRQNEETERDRRSRISTIAKLNQHIERTSIDYEERLKVIQKQQAQIAQLNEYMQRTAVDYEERLKVILEQQAQIAQLNEYMQRTAVDYEERLKVIHNQNAIIDGQRAALDTINRNVLVRILRSLRLVPRVY